MASDTESWASKLSSDDTAIQVSALREMANLTDIRGCTIELVKLSGSRDDEIRSFAASALESAVLPDTSDIEALSEVLYDGQDGEICYWAATMLGRLGGRLGTQAKLAVIALEACLSDSLYLPARERAAWALGQVGMPAAAAATTLRRTAEDAPPRLQRLVTKALRVIDEAA